MNKILPPTSGSGGTVPARNCNSTQHPDLGAKTNQNSFETYCIYQTTRTSGGIQFLQGIVTLHNIPTKASNRPR